MKVSLIIWMIPYLEDSQPSVIGTPVAEKSQQAYCKLALHSFMEGFCVFFVVVLILLIEYI